MYHGYCIAESLYQDYADNIIATMSSDERDRTQVVATAISASSYFALEIFPGNHGRRRHVMFPSDQIFTRLIEDDGVFKSKVAEDASPDVY